MSLSPLAVELLRVLEAEGNGPPLTAESLRNVLRCAVGLYLQDGELEAALDSLMTAGRVEAVHSARLGRRFRVMRHDRGDMSEPGGPPGEAA